MIKKLFVTLVAFSVIFSLAGCSTAPSESKQQQVVAELRARGFADPKYSGDNDYAVTLDSCRLTIRQKNNGALVWLEEAGNNGAWDHYVNADEQLNAAWLRANPKGYAYAEVGSQPYDLTPCLAKG